MSIFAWHFINSAILKDIVKYKLAYGETECHNFKKSGRKSYEGD